MPSVAMVDQNNKKVKDVDLPGLFSTEVRPHLMHAAVVNQLANRRAGTAATKNKALVSGGGAKPWKQKGTGRARSGSNRSPLWRHGGTVQGPVPRDYSWNMPKQIRQRQGRADHHLWHDGHEGGAARCGARDGHPHPRSGQGRQARPEYPRQTCVTLSGARGKPRFQGRLQFRPEGQNPGRHRHPYGRHRPQCRDACRRVGDFR